MPEIAAIMVIICALSLRKERSFISMKNTRLYPFERNRYFSGKMLTSSDFQAEQTYFNNKRRFINNLMYGAGIICGCGVFSLDDLSILVESGVAIDGGGREIVMESSVVKKLSAIEGFETLKSNAASLCLRYKEEPVHAVYAMNQNNAEDGREYEYNRISEGYQLFLMDLEDADTGYQMEEEFLAAMVLYSDDDFIVKLVMPASVCRGKNVKAVVEVRKLSSEDKRLTYHGVLQIPVFLTAKGEHEQEIRLDDISMEAGTHIRKEYWFYIQDLPLADTTVLLKSGTVKAVIDGGEVKAKSGCSLKIVLTDEKPGELVGREIGRMSLEMKNMGGGGDYVRLADLMLERTENAYIIEEVVERGVRNYIMAPAQENLRKEYMEYFEKESSVFEPGELAPSALQGENQAVQGSRGVEMSSGILEIPLGESVRRGDVRYSGEIIHGLGKGNVYVDIGYEYITDDPALGSSSKNTIYGNPDLFEREKSVTVAAETAVKVFNDKGSFIVAAELLENANCLVLTYRWVAIKFPSGNDLGLMENYMGKSISTDMPTVVLGTRESHYFHVKFNGMESSSVAYELTEPGSGEITSDGVYTAPAKEGIYEIRIYCIDMPIICTYAYAIVKKKGYGDSEETT